MSHRIPEVTPEILLAHADWVRRLARQLVAEEDRADDLVQETWVAALSRPPRHGQNLKSWLAIVVRNLARKRGREESRRRRREAKVGDPTSTPHRTPSQTHRPDHALQQALLQRHVIDAVIELEEPYRSTVLLRYFSELSPAVIAEEQRTSVETIKTRLKRGLKRVRERIRVRWGNDVDPAVGLERWQVGLLFLANPRALPGFDFAGTTGTVASVPSGSSMFLGALIMTKKTTLIAGTALVLLLVGLLGTLTFKDSDTAVLPSSEAKPRSESPDPPLGETASLPSPTPEPRAEPDAKPATVEHVDASQESVPLPPDEPTLDPTNSPRISGRVLDSDGGNVVQATVFLLESQDELSSAKDELVRRLPHLLASETTPDVPWGIHRRTITDPTGAYSIDDAEPGPRWTLLATHPQLGVAVSSGLALQEEESLVVDLVLETGVRFVGRITGESGQPLEGVDVSIMGFSDGWGQIVASPKTDADGQYESIPLPYRTFTLDVSAKGYRDADSHGMVEIPSGQLESRHDYRLENAPVIRGTILDENGRTAHVRERIREATGIPDLTDENLLRRLRLKASIEAPENWTNFLSRYHPEGEVDLDNSRYSYTRHRGVDRHLTLWWENTLLGGVEISEGDEGPDLLVDLYKVTPPPLQGRIALQVRDAESLKPISPFDIVLTPVAVETSLRPFPERSSGVGDRRGRFETELKHLGTYSVSVEAKGYVSSWRKVVLSGAELRPQMTFDLHPPRAQVRGEVRGPDGKPLNGVRVHLLDEQGSPVFSGSWGTLTNAEGRCRFDQLAEGDYLLLAEPVDAAMSKRLSPGVARVRAFPEGTGKITLSPGFSTFVYPEGVSGPFQFRLLDADGIPLYDDSRMTVRHHGDGFNFVLPPGEYTLVTDCPSFRRHEQVFRARPDLKLRYELEPKVSRGTLKRD